MAGMQSSELEYIEHSSQLPLKCSVVSIENSSPHWHHEYEVFFVLKGGVAVHCEEKDWRMETGDIFLFNSCDIHSINQPEPENLCLVLQFSPDVFTDVYKSNFRFELNTRSAAGMTSDVSHLLKHELAQMGLLVYEKPNGYQFFIKSSLYGFIGLMFKHLQYKVEPVSKLPVDNRLKDFDAVKKYIKQRFSVEINVEQMCADLAMSRAKLYRVLKDAGAESYKSLVNYYRVEHAKGLLRNTNSAIQYIATASGFESDSSFYRVFKELTSVSPNQYRELPKNNDVPFGIQGYASYYMPAAIDALKKY